MNVIFFVLGMSTCAIGFLSFMVYKLNAKLKKSQVECEKSKASPPPKNINGYSGRVTDVFSSTGRKFIYMDLTPEWEKSIYRRNVLFVSDNATCSLRDIKEKLVDANTEQNMLLYCKLVFIKEDRVIFKVADVYGEATFEADVKSVPISVEDLEKIMGHMIIFKVYLNDQYDVKVISVSPTRYRKDVV